MTLLSLVLLAILLYLPDLCSLGLRPLESHTSFRHALSHFPSAFGTGTDHIHATISMEQYDGRKFPIRRHVAEHPLSGAKPEHGVPEEYKGSEKDRQDMKTLGKDQVLRVGCL
jgi:hypothetical protein